MNRHIIIFCSLFCPLFAIGQIGSFEEYRIQQEKAFADYAEQQRTAFEEFRIKRSIEFGNYLGKDWVKMEVTEGEDAPIPKPIDPKAIKPEGESISIAVPKTVPLPAPPKQIDLTIKPLEKSSPHLFPFDFYGLETSVRIDENYTLKMNNVNEQEVKKQWNKLSALKEQDLLDDCVRNRKELALSDWAYVQFMNKLTEAYYGGKDKNEAAFLQGYLLTQSGYDIRFVSETGRLLLGVAIDSPVFGIAYILINNRRYYLINYKERGGSFYTFNDSFSDESQQVSMVIDSEMDKIPFKESKPTNYVAEAHANATVKTSVNLNLIEFYNDYPQCEWTIYARCPMSKQLQEKVLPPLAANIEGKSEKEGADILINFVQTAFKYQTDDEQFGYEKPLFIDETFYYPASDCEDRSILFSYLVRELMGLDVVLLEYPNHLCTAVLFNEDIKGDALVIDRKRYMICDPTFIGANIGVVHSDYKSIQPKVYTID